MKRNTLSCIATVSNNSYSLHSATILTHTIACSHIFFSETQRCYSRNDVRSLLYSSVVNMEICKITNFENSQKINKNSYNNHFFIVVIRRKRKFILAINIGVTITFLRSNMSNRFHFQCRVSHQDAFARLARPNANTTIIPRR